MLLIKNISNDWIVNMVNRERKLNSYFYREHYVEYIILSTYSDIRTHKINMLLFVIMA